MIAPSDVTTDVTLQQINSNQVFVSNLSKVNIPQGSNITPVVPKLPTLSGSGAGYIVTTPMPITLNQPLPVGVQVLTTVPTPAMQTALAIAPSPTSLPTALSAPMNSTTIDDNVPHRTPMIIAKNGATMDEQSTYDVFTGSGTSAPVTSTGTGLQTQQTSVVTSNAPTDKPYVKWVLLGIVLLVIFYKG